MRVELICDNPECSRHAEPGDQPPTRRGRLIRAPRRWTVQVTDELINESRFALADKHEMQCPACGEAAERIVGGTV